MKLKTLIAICFFICTTSILPTAVSAADSEVYVITTDYIGNTYYMAYNDDGTFSEMVWVGTTPSPSYGNAIGDFDGDGDYDFVVAGGPKPGSIWLFEKLGPGNDFAAPQPVGTWDGGSSSGDLAAADFDGDGKDDVVMTYYDSVDCELYLNYNADSGQFTRSTLTAAASKWSIGVDAADVDNDGDIDFIVAPYASAGEFSVNYANLNNGDGTFTTETFAAGTSDPYWGISVADFSANGLVDLLAATYGYIDIYRGSESGSFDYDPDGEMATGSYYPSPIDNFDVNGDGLEDLLVGAVGNNAYQVGVLLNQGDGSFAPIAVYGGEASYPLSAISALPYHPNQLPEALADASETQTYVGETIRFDGTGSADDDGEIVSYVWDFDDGTGAEGATPEHAYDAPGTYAVTLTVIDDMGAESSDRIQIEVEEIPSISAKIRIRPRTLNLGSKGKWVTAWIKLPRGYRASEIDLSTVCLLAKNADPVFAYTSSKRGWFYKLRKKLRNKRWLKVRFNRQAVAAAIAVPARKTVLQVQGNLNHDGKQMSFEGSDTIRTKAAKKAKIKKHKKTKIKKHKKAKTKKKSYRGKKK